MTPLPQITRERPIPQLPLLDPAEVLAAAKASPEGVWLSPAAQALYEKAGGHAGGWVVRSEPVRSLLTLSPSTLSHRIRRAWTRMDCERCEGIRFHQQEKN